MNRAVIEFFCGSWPKDLREDLITKLSSVSPEAIFNSMTGKFSQKQKESFWKLIQNNYETRIFLERNKVNYRYFVDSEKKEYRFYLHGKLTEVIEIRNGERFQFHSCHFSLENYSEKNMTEISQEEYEKETKEFSWNEGNFDLCQKRDSFLR